MKITESRLKELIEEEIAQMIESGEIDEGILDRLKARGAGAMTKMKGAGRGMLQKGLGAVAGAAGEEEMAAKMKGKAADTAAATAGKAEAQKMLSLMNSHLANIQKDLKKLGIDPTTPGIKGALTALQRAVSGTIAKKAGAA
tara:strand:+ start:10012 stop:10437 length:426 start_codon:yes stop_codon:yes gene_type:complete